MSLFQSNFNSLYGKTEEGVYKDLYRKKGAPAAQRMDTRLGEAGDDEEDEDEEEAPAAPAPAASADAPDAPAAASEGNFFTQDYMGFPNWLIGVFLLGFAYAYRRRKKAESEA